ncbi:putative quinone oxidoreductase [Pseudovirgaria hyperparasitica]|uniref:Putative quinone oxidoreductase n=1 Tax=Pseudovirgaria hyperparasitica TaxID=470096 RepID=A0A6A6VVD2_9PEZI|nr:putative quinone oxidoreductase [Pseudovirgaria hyperparasitica]KAF2753829.1 putative quinone oxidoreductase [Pseudovirgaria hyperparasitica]
MSPTMRAVEIKNGKGNADSLYHTDVPKPTPKGSEALVKIKAFGLNRMDLLQREGQYPVPPQASKILGVEFSGVIESFGGDAERGFKVGDEVFGLAYGGAYAEYIAVSTHMLVHKPKELSWEECAGIPETWITATQAIYLIGQYKPGDSILWHAGGSSVSLSGIQLSHADSPSGVFATTRSDEKNDFLVKELGVKAAFNTKTSLDWADEVLKATDGKGVDIIVDFIGADTFGPNLKAIAKDGRIVMLGFMSGAEIPAGVSLGPFIAKRIRYEGSSLRSRDEEYQGKLRDQLVEHALPRFKDKRFKVFVEKVFKWEDVIDAHKLMESNQTKGKIICTIS